MIGEVAFRWEGVPVRAVLDRRGRWECDGPAALAELLNRSFSPGALVGRRRDAHRARLKEVARRFGGRAAMPPPDLFPPPRHPEDHPGYLRLRGQPTG